MGLSDFLKSSKQKELEEAKKEIEHLKKLLSPEMQEADSVREYIASMEKEKAEAEKSKAELEKSVSQLNDALSSLNHEIEEKKKQVVILEDEILFQDFGLYTPRYEFASSEDYKNRLDDIRKQQKEMIRNETAVSGAKDWTVNGSKPQGKKMIKDMQKLLLRAFNSDCEEAISKVKYNNFEASLKRITASRNAISKLGTVMSLSISFKYFHLKEDELALAFEYQQKKQEEKEEQRMIREQLREEAKLQKEIEEARKNIEKEKKHYTNALLKAEQSYSFANTDEEKEIWRQKIQELQEHLTEVKRNLADIDYREANKRAGYVYVISNIGSFGENVYKIGMTRRLNPQDRVDELGGASVPFNFDVHAMIFSDDAPRLEAALHNEFADRKINMVNQRREFFQVTLEEIESAVKKNFEKGVEFIKLADAEQFRRSRKMKELSRNSKNGTPPDIIQPAQISTDKPECLHSVPANQEILYTLWGAYEMPEPYTLCLKKGPRTDLQEIMI